ncbi:MAG TPA: class I SAM-dependent methyltransferase [Burkholderiales bacterium]|nr:class I SAM-dependent methyltransferase [Burkholderiales bacterium]
METLEHCPVCDGTALRRLLTAPDYESHTGEYSIVECGGCGVAFTNPRPLEAELPKLYAQRSTADFPQMGGLTQRLRDYAIDRYLASQLRAGPAPGNTPFAALDYGCGDGALTRGLIRFGAARASPVHVTAVDFHDVAPSSLVGAGSVVAYQSNSAWHANRGRYDAIFLRHVLEHHPRPMRLLGELATALVSGGRLFIEVPNRRSVWARIFRHAYSGYYLPRHLLHFDEASLLGTLERAGLDAVRVDRAHTPLIGRSLGYLTGWNIGNTGPLGLASYPLQVGLDALFYRSSTLRAVGTCRG